MLLSLIKIINYKKVITRFVRSKAINLRIRRGNIFKTTQHRCTNIACVRFYFRRSIYKYRALFCILLQLSIAIDTRENKKIKHINKTLHREGLLKILF